MDIGVMIETVAESRCGFDLDLRLCRRYLLACVLWWQRNGRSLTNLRATELPEDIIENVPHGCHGCDVHHGRSGNVGRECLTRISVAMAVGNRLRVEIDLSLKNQSVSRLGAVNKQVFGVAH